MSDFKKSAEIALDRLGIHPTSSQQSFMEEWEKAAYDAGWREAMKECEKIAAKEYNENGAVAALHVLKEIRARIGMK